jgi:ubiquinone/menaquinone biosynthesis C-methylase UbiE
MWYDLFSHVYDLALEPLYRDARRQMANALSPKQGDTVLDLACGTGQNFPYIAPWLGSRGRLIGLDASKGMLRKAAQRVERHGWTNVLTVHQDAHHVTRAGLQLATGDQFTVNSVVCTLGFSTFTDWVHALEQAVDLLPPGGRIVVMDVFAERRTFQTWMVEQLARADLNRQVWMELKRMVRAFEWRYLQGSPRKYGGRIYLAIGEK